MNYLFVIWKCLLRSIREIRGFPYEDVINRISTKMTSRTLFPHEHDTFLYSPIFFIDDCVLFFFLLRRETKLFVLFIKWHARWDMDIWPALRGILGIYMLSQAIVGLRHTSCIIWEVRPCCIGREVCADYEYAMFIHTSNTCSCNAHFSYKFIIFHKSWLNRLFFKDNLGLIFS